MTAPEGTPDQAEIIAFLADPASHGGQPVERIDTHGAVIILVGDTVLKLKRAVAYPYMDFSTPERRAAMCRAEVAVNRRTAPALYRGVGAVTRAADGALAIDGDGQPVDWLVVMNRFDQALLFDRLAGQGALTPALIDRLAEEIARFHAAAERRPGGGAAAMRWVVEENQQEFAASPAIFPARPVAALGAATRQALEAAAPLLDARAAAGFVRHCHGDLHLRNICLLDGQPTLFDAIEFNEAIAEIDVLYDLAFLIMDLLQHGLANEANRLFNRYHELAGDDAGVALLPLFVAVRAAVRAKVAGSALSAQADPARRQAADAEIGRYLALGIDSLEPARPRLVAIGGLSGTGKTVAARAVAPGLGATPGAVILRSDIIRKALFGVAPEARLPEAGYAAGVTAEVYGTIARRAAALLRAGHSVIADAVYARPEERQGLAAIAADAGLPFAGFWLTAPMAVLLERVSARQGDASDADEAVVRLQAGFDPGAGGWTAIDAAGPPDRTAAAIREHLDIAPPPS